MGWKGEEGRAGRRKRRCRRLWLGRLLYCHRGFRRSRLCGRGSLGGVRRATREGVGDISTVVCAEPDDVVGFAVSTWDDAVPLVFIRVPGKVVSAFFESVFADFDGG